MLVTVQYWYSISTVQEILKDLSKRNRNKQVSIKKRFLKRNLADVCRDSSINALADKVQKQEVPCT